MFIADRNCSFSLAKIIKKTGTSPTFECKIIGFKCQTMAQVNFNVGLEEQK